MSDTSSQCSAAPGSAERHAHDAMAAALKIVVNAAYGYLAAGGLTRFADVHAANEVTRRGRELLALLCRELAARVDASARALGVTPFAVLLAAYAALLARWSTEAERYWNRDASALGIPVTYDFEFELAEAAEAERSRELRSGEPAEVELQAPAKT